MSALARGSVIIESIIGALTIQAVHAVATCMAEGIVSLPSVCRNKEMWAYRVAVETMAATTGGRS